MKRVAVIHEDGRVLRTYDIDFGNLDREPMDHWYFGQARENAIADKLIATSETKQISCRFADDLGGEQTSEHSAAQASSLTRKSAGPAAAKRHDDTDQSRSEAPNLKPTPLRRLANIMAWAALIIALIAAVWAIVSISLSAT